MSNALEHVDQLFHDGKTPKVEKSHCCLCHRKLKRNKLVRGNFCIQCEGRCNQVARGLLSERDADSLLRYMSQDLEEEVWLIDGVQYRKRPNGDLFKAKVVIEDLVEPDGLIEINKNTTCTS